MCSLYLSGINLHPSPFLMAPFFPIAQHCSMSSPLKRKAEDPNESRASPPLPLTISNSAPCGDPRCLIPTCHKGPYTTLYFYPPFSRAEIVAEVSPFFFWDLQIFADSILSPINRRARSNRSYGTCTAWTTSLRSIATTIYST